MPDSRVTYMSHDPQSVRAGHDREEVVEHVGHVRQE
jgi:hypothetical protein